MEGSGRVGKSEEVGFEGRLEGIELRTVADVFGEGVPEGGGGDTEGPVPQGSVLGYGKG